MKSFAVLIKEDSGAIALVNSNRMDYPELLLSGYCPVKEGGQSECREFIDSYFDQNNVPLENQIFLTIQ